MANNCILHPNEPAVVSCAYCGAGICESCARASSYLVGNRPICHHCNHVVAKNEIRRVHRLRLKLVIKSLLIVLFMAGGFFFYSEHLILMWLLVGLVSAFSAFGSHDSTVDHIFHNSVLDANVHQRSVSGSTIMRALLTFVLGPLGGLGWLVTNVFQFIKSGASLRKAIGVLQL